MLGIPVWAWIVAALIWCVITWRASRARKAARLPNAMEGYRRPEAGGRF